MANPNNSKVQFRAAIDTLGNQIGVEIKIEDPDKIARYSVFKGIQRPGMGNQETWSVENCTNAGGCFPIVVEERLGRHLNPAPESNIIKAFGS